MINVATFLTLVMSATELIMYNITPSFYNKEHPCIDHFSFLCTIHTLNQYIKTCLDASYRQFHLYYQAIISFILCQPTNKLLLDYNYNQCFSL